MRLLGLRWIILALALGLGVLVATADDAEIASLDPHHPATVLPLIANRLHAAHAAVRVWGNALLAAADAFRKHFRHNLPEPEEELLR